VRLSSLLEKCFFIVVEINFSIFDNKYGGGGSEDE